MCILQEYFLVESTSGIVKVNKDNIDRETAETIVLEILVEDVHGVAQTPQTATGKNKRNPAFIYLCKDISNDFGQEKF